ncbi:hypothetical protein [Luteolibacter sp.]|uniref:hypothetical protein n=1 Tax=Luteolibacter sp. TaxID=1962973 RepID=UPI00326509E0
MGKPMAECPVLKEAPSGTPFVAAGDELHDLTGILREKKVSLQNGWALWNQTQRLVVVHGVMLDQWRVEELTGFREQTRNVKLSVDWIRSGKPEGFPAENEPVLASVSQTVQPGLITPGASQVEIPSWKCSFFIRAESYVLTKDMVSSQLSLSWDIPDGDGIQHGNLYSLLYLRDNRAVPLATWHAAGHGPAWRINARSEILLADEIPWRDARLLQGGDKFTSCLDSTLESEWHDLRELPIAGSLKLFTMEVPDDDIRSLAGMPAVPQEKDPFAEAPKTESILSPDLPVAVIPKDLEGYLAGPVYDLRSCLSKTAVVFDQGDFAAYDATTKRIFVWCKGDSTIDLIAQVFTLMDCRGPQENVLCEVWIAAGPAPDPGIARFSVLSKSGVKASIELLDAKEDVFASFLAEPSFGTDPMMELRSDFLCNFQQPEKFDWHKKSEVKLESGATILADGAKLRDGRTLKQGLRATVVKEPVRAVR